MVLGTLEVPYSVHRSVILPFRIVQLDADPLSRRELHKIKQRFSK
jgi:hypothetical protein